MGGTMVKASATARPEPGITTAAIVTSIAAAADEVVMADACRRPDVAYLCFLLLIIFIAAPRCSLLAAWLDETIREEG